MEVLLAATSSFYFKKWEKPVLIDTFPGITEKLNLHCI